MELLHVAPERSGREKNTFLRRHGFLGNGGGNDLNQNEGTVA